MIRNLVFLFCLSGALSGFGTPTDAKSSKEKIIGYIESKLQKNDGGYGWEDQYDGHLTPTFAVTGILYHLGSLSHDRQALADYMKTRHPQKGPNKEAGPSGTEMRNLVYQQVQALTWLDSDASQFKEEVSGWKTQARKLANYEKGGNPVFMQEMMAPVCRYLLGLPQDQEMISYILERRRPNGSFNNIPANDGGDGNIMNTYWGIYGLSVLTETIDLKEETIMWIQDCQLNNGGFTHQPDPEIGVNDDVAYTWAAVKALKILDAEPASIRMCVKYLLSLQNDDGGFGNRPGWHSTPMATYYAVEALKELGALPELEGERKNTNTTRPANQNIFNGYRIFTVQFQAHGVGSPKEAVYMADKFKIDLWGSKNASKEWLQEAQRIADEKSVKTLFFHSDEDHDTDFKIEGQGSFSHILDPAYPAGSDFTYKPGEINWEGFKLGYLEPLLENDGALLLQVSNNEPLSRILLDESVNREGYAAISTIHFSQNFLFWLPHLNQYRYKLPFVALQDAHGPESWWWMHELAAYRTLFIAKEPTYQGLTEALKNNWIVAVRHDEVSGYKTRMLGGAGGVQEFVRRSEDQWRWWDKETSAMTKPKAVITVVKPSDVFEEGRPETGMIVRIRTRWQSVRQNLQKPEVKLDRVEIDGKEVECAYAQREGRNTISDAFYTYAIPDPAEGEHVVKAYVTDLNTGKSEIITERFIVNR